MLCQKNLHELRTPAFNLITVWNWNFSNRISSIVKWYRVEIQLGDNHISILENQFQYVTWYISFLKKDIHTHQEAPDKEECKSHDRCFYLSA